MRRCGVAVLLLVAGWARAQVDQLNNDHLVIGELRPRNVSAEDVRRTAAEAVDIYSRFHLPQGGDEFQKAFLVRVDYAFSAPLTGQGPRRLFVGNQYHIGLGMSFGRCNLEGACVLLEGQHKNLSVTANVETPHIYEREYMFKAEERVLSKVSVRPSRGAPPTSTHDPALDYRHQTFVVDYDATSLEPLHEDTAQPTLPTEESPRLNVTLHAEPEGGPSSPQPVVTKAEKATTEEENDDEYVDVYEETPATPK